ncbi:MAG: hypothetical protein SCL54_07530 [Bacillota bacterium]|nr:hypothetical protein [Bacillota bacterium]
MEQKFVLIKIMKRLRWLFSKTEVDFEMLISILTLKLTLDERKSPINLSDGKEKKIKGLKANLFMLVFVGFFVGMLMTTPFDLYYKITIVASMDLFFMVMYMVSDFSGVLLDVRDKNIIMTKPVNQQTMNAARVIHIVYYMVAMFLALNLMSMVIGTGIYGPKILLAFFVMMVALSFLIVIITTILYSSLLEKFSGEKLKDIINIFQIVLSITTILAYQVAARIFEFVDLQLTINIKWWTYLIPPAWYAGLFKVIVEGSMDPAYVIMAITGILVPIVSGMILIKWIFPKFESYLMKLQIEDGVFISKDNLGSRIKSMLFGIFSKDHTELAFMKFADSNLSRDRKLKLMIYPNQAISMLFPFIMLFPIIQGSEGIVAGIAGLKGTMAYVALYMSTMFFTTNFDFVQYSEKFEASFIYDSFPINNKNIIMTGALKAYYFKYVLPGMVVMSAIFVLLCGVVSIWGVLLVNVMTVLLLAFKINFSKLSLPFSREMIPGGNKNMGATFVYMGICGAIAAAHFFILKNNPLLNVCIGLIAVVLIKVAFSKALKRQII